MRLFSALVAITILFSQRVAAQQEGSTWSLQRCIQYAIDHNISIRQDSLNARLARFTLVQSQLSRIPTASASASYGTNFGRSVNPTTNQFVEGSYRSFSPSASASVLVFGGLQVKNTIERNKYSLAASIADLDQLKDDISLNIANAYLVALLAHEQIKINGNQISLSKAQLSQTKAFAESGRLPELNVAQLESQLATDSSNLINAISSYNADVLDLKALLNLDFATPFELEVPSVELPGQFEVMSLDPALIFEKAHLRFGSVRGSKFRVSAAEKGLAAAKGALYPQLTVGYQLGSSYASNYQTYTYKESGQQLSGVAVDSANNKFYNVYQPAFTTTANSVGFSSQFENNLRHSVYLNLSIPIFSGWQYSYSVKQARNNLESQKLNQFSAELTLKQNVYKAHNNAVNSIQKYNAAVRAEQAAARALEFARKRYDLGLTSTVDLLVTQQSQFTAASNLVIAKYDLIFKLKVIDYYLGKELKL